jgi:transcriptional regulator with XRE-family HTH domain
MPGERPSPAWARRLAELRRARAWSPADLACELKKLRDGLPSGRSLAHMIQMDWESGKHRPGPRYRLLLAAVYDADEQDIFGGELASPAISLRSVDRRDVLAAFCLSPAADVTASHPRQVAPELIDYFRSQLAGHYCADAFLGPHFLIPTVTEQYRLINTLTGSAAGKVRAELLEVATAYAALIGWLHQDAGNTPQSAYWRSATLDMAHRRDDPDLISYALANKAMLATDMGNGQTVIDFSEAARLGGRRLMPKTRIMAAVQSAHGHSLVGQRRECDRLLDAAAHLAGQVGDDHVWGNACRRTPGYFEVHRATCYGRLGADGEAATLWSEILDVMPASARRDTAVFRARHAAALAATGHAEETKRIAEDSVKLVHETGSARLRQELLAIPAKMSAWADTTTGRELDEVLASIR